MKISEKILRKKFSIHNAQKGMNIFLRWVLIALAFYLIAEFVPGISVASGTTALILAFFWGVANVLLKPILILFTLPITLFTLGLFTLVINGFLFWLLSTFVKGFFVESFGSAMIGAFVLTVVSWGINRLGEGREGRNMPSRVR